MSSIGRYLPFLAMVFGVSSCDDAVNGAQDEPQQFSKCGNSLGAGVSEVVNADMASLQICLNENVRVEKWSLITSKVGEPESFRLLKLPNGAASFDNPSAELCASPEGNDRTRTNIYYVGSLSSIKPAQRAISECT